VVNVTSSVAIITRVIYPYHSSTWEPYQINKRIKALQTVSSLVINL